MNITTILSIALAISMLGNAALTKVYLGARDEIAAGEVLLQTATDAAKLCSKATQNMKDLADQREKEAKTARAAAAAAARGRDQRADDILNTPASDPDDCKAAAHRATTWLKGRK